MKPRSGRLAWPLFVIATLFCIGSLSLLGLDVAAGGTAPAEAVGQAMFILVFVAFGVVGALIASRRPDNPVGWLFLAAAMLEWMRTLAGNYLELQPAGAWAAEAAWIGLLLDQPGPGVAMLAFVLFPDGRFLSPGWRRFGFVLIGWIAASMTLPVAVEYAPSGIAVDVAALEEWRVWSTPVLLVAAVGALVARFRRGSTLVRQQMKWLVAAAGALVIAFIATTVVFGTGQDPQGLVARAVFFLVFVPAVASIPIAVGVGVLRYRLYEIDRIISRALVYAVVTAVLMAGYAGMVVAFQALLRPVTGESDLAVAASTLAVAAAFGPVRRRVRRSVDGRFYRSRYDAARTVESFGHRLRDELDLDALRRELAGTARAALTPAHVGVWLYETRETQR